MTQTETSMVLGANWRLADAKNSMVLRKQPGRRVHGRNRKDKRERTHQLSCFVNGWVFFCTCGPGRFRFICSLREHSELYKLCITLDDCWLEPILSACLRCRALIGAYLLCCLCELLRCAVLCLRSKESKEIQEGSPANNINVGNYKLRRAERWEKIPKMSSEVGEI